MLRKNLVAALAAACFALSAASAHAADDYTVKDSTGTTITIRAKEVSSKKLTTHTVADSAGTLIDPATATLQGTGNTSLGSIDTSAAGLLTSLGAVGASPTANTVQARLKAINDTLGAGVAVTVSGVSTAANQATGNGTLASILSAVQAATPAGANIIGDVGSASFSATCTTLTLPGTGGTYASGDLVANSATAGSVTPLSCLVARYSGGPLTVTKARILTSTTGVSNAGFRVHLYTASPTVTNGNDAAYLSTASGHFCRIDVILDVAFSDGADGSGVPYTGTTCTRVLSASQTVYLLVEARSAYAWTAGQTLTLTLEGFN